MSYIEHVSMVGRKLTSRIYGIVAGWDVFILFDVPLMSTYMIEKKIN